MVPCYHNLINKENRALGVRNSYSPRALSITMRFITAVLILSGLIIGAGMFAIPYAFAQAGFWLGVTEFIILSGLILLVHIIYSEIVLNTQPLHRLPGYIKIYLGHNAYKLTVFSVLFGTIGSLLIYAILGSDFIINILKITNPGYINDSSGIIIVTILSLTVGIITLFKLNKEALINGILTAILIIFILFLIVRLWPTVQLSNFAPTNFNNTFLLYGILIFALNGASAIPEVVTILKKNKKSTRLAVIIGSLIPAVIYFLFTFVMAGNQNAFNHPNAITSLSNSNNQLMPIVGNIVGFLAVFTSFIVLSLNLQSLLILDLKFNKWLAWFAVSFSSIFLYKLGLYDFTSIMGYMGTIFGGLDIILLILCFHKLKTLNGNKLTLWSHIWKITVVVLIIIGIAQSVL